MTVLVSWARALGGVVSGRQVLCSGPGHGPSDRSLVVWQSPNAPGGFRTHSHADDGFQACRDHVAGLIGVPMFQAGQ